MKEAGLTGMSLELSDGEIAEGLEQAFLRHLKQEGGVGNNVQLEIIRRLVACPKLQGVDAADMALCLSLVNKDEVLENSFFLSRARQLVDAHEPYHFTNVLSSLETILFFLKYLDKEDLAQCYQEYRKVNRGNPVALQYVAKAERSYSPGYELVQTKGRNLLSESDVQDILAEMNIPGRNKNDMVDGLRQIFFWWAQLMKETFDLLVLPHHTQVVCMLMCLEFIVGDEIPDCGALIAEMGTGEGKSAVIAGLALYCCTKLGKKVHVVVDDENLVERDFLTYRDLFAQFKTKNGETIKAQLCVSASKKANRYSKDENIRPRVDPEGDIVYIEAKHVQSFYTNLAKQGGTNFDEAFKGRILILDEVDALVIDEAPCVPFVYENDDLTRFATRLGDALLRGKQGAQLEAMATTEAEMKVARSFTAAQQKAEKWVLNQDYAVDSSGQRYVRVVQGRVSEGSWSLALELKNYVDRYTDRIIYNERLFVMNRAHAFQKYERIVGLSGSVGNDAERSFLTSIYKAKFFKVPWFLTTCKNSPFYAADSRGVFIEDDEHRQWLATCDKAFEWRERAPVLIIASHRAKAARLAQDLHAMAEARGLHARDVVRNLSREVYETQPEVFKQNLFKATQGIGQGSDKKWRIAVTDPRGGRGTDYRVSDPVADQNGGLMLIVMHIPKQSRDWVQFLGRTARQDKHGQWLAVLNKKEYAAEIDKFKTPLSPGTAVDTILDWGNKETTENLKSVNGHYHRGLRVNEISEQVAARKLLDNPANREIMVRICSEYQSLSIHQINMLARGMKGLDVKSIPTKAQEVGAVKSVEVSPGRPSLRSVGFPSSQQSAPRDIVIVMDRSTSMLSKDAGGKSRFELCRDCILGIFNSNVEDQDYLGLLTFESQVRESFPLTKKGGNGSRLTSLIQNLPNPDGLTKFHDGVMEGLERLRAGSSSAKYLVALTDGDDNMSRSQPNGEKVTEYLRSPDADVNIIVITVGRDIKVKMIETCKQWASIVKAAGKVGLYIPADQPSEIAQAFTKVAAIIADDAEGEAEL